MTRSTLKGGSGILLAAFFALAVAACAQSAPPPEQSTESAIPTSAPAVAPVSGDSEPAAEPTSAPVESVEATPAVALPAGELPATQAPTSAPAEEAKARPIAPDIPNVEGIDAWLNTDMELTIQELVGEGNVVLVDFWTYTCVNCIRTLPFLREWWSQYEDDGLVILGIHTPEFEFEKDFENVSDALMTHNIGWPVAQDNDMVTWRNFENRYWPAKYLFNSHGEMIYSHFGEGAYGETEQKIRNALVEAGADLSDDPLDLPEDQVRDAAFQSARIGGSAPVTPELYAGWQRNVGVARAGRHPYVAQYEDYFQSILDDGSGIIDVQVPQDLHPHLLYFQGIWSVEPERIRHGRETEELEDYLALNYASKSVNAVLTSDSGEPYEVIVTVDGAMLTEENAGADIQWDENGYSYILVDEPRMYGIVDNPQYLPQSILTMRSNSDDFGLFAFTFGVYAEGP